MRVFNVLLCILCFVQISAQDTFWSYVDMSGDASEEPYDLEIRNDTVFIWGLGTCGNERCMHYYQFSTAGDLILFKDYPGVIPGRRVSFLNNTFYLPIKHLDDVNEGSDGFRLGQYNLDGNLLKTVKYDLDDHPNSPIFEADFYFSYGSIAYSEHIIIYGEVLDEEENSQTRQTCMFWFDENDMSLDTIIFINPKEQVFDTWDAKIDNNGLLTMLVEYQDISTDGSTTDYISYVKYDKSGRLVDFWEGIPWSRRYAHNTLVVTDQNDVIMPFDLNDISTGNKEVMKIDSLGNIKWQEVIGLKQVPIGNRGYLDLMQSTDGNIMGCGNARSVIAEFDGAHIFKLDYHTGEMLWDRAYSDWGTQTTGLRRPNHIFLDNIKELSDGSFFASGTRRRSVFVDGVTKLVEDLFLIRVDADGCLEPGCGGTKQALRGVPVYDFVLTPESLWYYHKFGSESDIIKKTYRWVDTDTFLLEGSTTEFLDPREDGFYTEFSDFLFSTSQGGRKIFIGEDKEELLYDFNMDVGDVFTSTYVDFELEVIESDTMLLSNKAKRRYWVLACTENPNNKITWIDGIGTYYGVQWPRNFCSGDYGDKTLTCFYRWERLAHMNPDVGGCLMPSSTDDNDFLALSAISAHPNPTSDRLTITSPPDLYIERTELMDTKGVTQTRFHNKTTEVYYDLSSYPSGLYFVSVYTGKGSVVKKIVVE